MSIIDYLYGRCDANAQHMLTGDNTHENLYGVSISQEAVEKDEEERKRYKEEMYKAILSSEDALITEYLQNKQKEEFDENQYFMEGVLDTREGWLERERFIMPTQIPCLNFGGLDFYDIDQTIINYEYVTNMINELEKILASSTSMLSQYTNSHKSSIVSEIELAISDFQSEISTIRRDHLVELARERKRLTTPHP